ncbi:MAG: DUF6448 family protein [Ignavibacteriaceae bacterium]|jgi:hypothetical protein|nr:DUF6448 family protein [Ignavibacteriaceae bacterium]
MSLNFKITSVSFLLSLSIIFLLSSSASAHCDGMNGPVVKAAIKAIETGNVNYVLIWVQKADEEIIKNAFKKTLAVRKLSKEAQELADLYFYETVVRIHRAGEGEPYTGLKPADRNIDPAIIAADSSIAVKSLKPLEKVFADPIPEEIINLFNDVVTRMNYKVDDVIAGRDFVEHYVHFIHSVEHYQQASDLSNEEHSHQTETHKHNGENTMKLKIPESMKTEHDKLHEILANATKETGEIGATAKEVAKVLHNHFVKEEEIAIPPLGLLTDIVNGHITEDMKQVLVLTDQLKSELNQMLEEHKQIVSALDKFEAAAKKLNREEYVEFAADLKLHAKNEEEVTYPTAILIGEYLKLKLK